jgi:hypothetical protein
LCEEEPSIGQDCERCGKRKHAFWEDPVGDLLNYLCEPRPWANKMFAIAHNAKARVALHSQPGDIIKMAAQTNNEWAQYHVHES